MLDREGSLTVGAGDDVLRTEPRVLGRVGRTVAPRLRATRGW